jgi:hypothetical protein
MYRAKRVSTRLRKKADDLSYEMDRLYREGDKKRAAEMYVKINDLEKEITEVTRFSSNRKAQKKFEDALARQEYELRESEKAKAEIVVTPAESPKKSKRDLREEARIAQKIACLYNENIKD